MEPEYRDKSDGIMDNLGLVFRVSISGGRRGIFSAPYGPERLWVQSSRLLNVYKGLFLRELSDRAVIKLATDLQLNSSSKWSCNTTPPYAFIACIPTKSPLL